MEVVVEQEKMITTEISLLVREFRIGDHVEVFRGEWVGRQGLVVEFGAVGLLHILEVIFLVLFT